MAAMLHLTHLRSFSNVAGTGRADARRLSFHGLSSGAGPCYETSAGCSHRGLGPSCDGGHAKDSADVLASERRKQVMNLWQQVQKRGE
jgi:hypothetical protein